MEEDRVIAAISVEIKVNRESIYSIRAIPVTAADFKKSNQKDKTIQQVIQFIRGRWPTNLAARELSQFYLRRGSLSVIDACLMFSDRVVNPAQLLRVISDQFHNGHPGIARIARIHVNWANMDRDIEDLVEQCSRCYQAAKNHVRIDRIP